MFVRKISLTLNALILCLLIIATPAWASGEQFYDSPHRHIEINDKTLFPEGIDFNPKTGKFVVGSFRQGAVYEIDDDGNNRPIVDDKRLHSVVSVRVDSKNNRLLVANSDIGSSIRSYKGGSKRLAALGIYDLDTGEPLQYVDLAKLAPNRDHLANDIAIDNEGNAYVTDSFSPIIYKVTPQGIASIFLENDVFFGKGINLNGIRYHPNGYLIVVKKSEGLLFKIPLNNPESFHAIQLPKKLVGGDGLVMVDNNQMIVITNKASGQSLNTAFSLYSDDDWQTASVKEELLFDDVYPTTGTIKNNEIFVVYTKLNTLFAAPSDLKEGIKQTPVIAKIGAVARKAKAFVYTEVQNSVSFNNFPWKDINAAISSQSGFISKTWLFGLGSHSTGGFYSFDSLENAQKYVTGFFPEVARKKGAAVTMRIFDADAVKSASIGMNSVHFGYRLHKKPAAYVYTELQASIPFDSYNWRASNERLKNTTGLLSKTWLSGAGNNSLGGIYAFDTIEHAKNFAINQFPMLAKSLNVAFYSRIFDARITEDASLGMNSPYYSQ